MSKCKCVDRLEVQEHVSEFGSRIAHELAEEFGAACPELLSQAVLHVMARMVHLQVVHSDNLIDEDIETVLSATESAAMMHAIAIVSTLSKILIEAKQQEDIHGSH